MWLLFLCILTHNANAFAEAIPLTISGALGNALERNPSVLSAQEALRQADADLSYATSKALPVVSATGTANHLKQASASGSALFGGNPYNQYQFILGLEQPLYDASLWAAYRYQKKSIDLKKLDLSIAERALSQSVIENFYSVLLNERLLQILKDAYQVDQETLAIAERYFKIGRSQKLDVLQLKTQAALLSPKIAQTEEDMRTFAAQLATQLRGLNAQEIRLKGKLVSPPWEWVKQQVEGRKLSELPEMQQSHLLVEQFSDYRSVQMAGYWPKLSLLGQIGRSAYTKPDLLNQNTTAWSIGLTLSIPIFSGLSSIHQRQSLASQERQLEFSETKTSDAVSLGQVQTEKDLDVAQAQLKSSQQAAEYGRESLKEAQRTYRLQSINYLQYQSSQQAFLDAESAFYRARYNYIIAVAKHFSAMGVPLSTLAAKLEELSLKDSG